MKVLLANHTLGFHMGTEQMVDLLERHLILSQLRVRKLSSTSAFHLYLQTRKHLEWADIVCFFNFPSTLGIFPYCKKPVVWFCYDIPEEYSRPWKEPFEFLNRHMMRRPNRYVITISGLQATRFEKVYRRNVDYVLPLGVDYNFFSDGVRIPSSNDTFRILHVGAVGKFKNQLDSLEAFKYFARLVPNSQLTFVGPKINVGSGPQYWEKLERRIGMYGLQNKVIMAGGISRVGLKNYYYGSDVLLHPASESTGTITLAEALSTSIPIIVNENYIGKSIVDNFGLVTDDYVAALLEVHKNRQHHNELAVRGSEWVRDNLSIDSYAKKAIGIFEEVLGYSRTYRNWWMRTTKEL